MSLEKLLSDLESGKVSAAQVQENILEALNDTRINSSVPDEHKDWFQTGVDCAMIRLGLKEFFVHEEA